MCVDKSKVRFIDWGIKALLPTK